MQITTFFVPVHDDGREQERMNAFLRGRRVLKVDHALVEGGWAFCVEWMEGTAAPSGEEWKKKPRIDWKERLEPEVFARFSALRELRKTIAAEDGVPPYMVMTDAQMAAAAKFDPLTEAHLREIEGFGDARLEKYGTRIIKKPVF